MRSDRQGLQKKNLTASGATVVSLPPHLLFETNTTAMHNLQLRPLLPTLLLGLALGAQAATLKVGGNEAFATISQAIKSAAPGDVIIITEGTYTERLFIGKPLTLRGLGTAIIDGQMKGTVVDVRSDDVVIEGLHIINSDRSSLRDYCGIKVEDARRVTIRNNRLRSNQFSIQLMNCTDCEVAGNDVESDISEMQVMGNAIHCWKCERIHIHHNTVGHNRDGIYLEFVYESDIHHNRVAYCERYGLHFMFSHFNRYFDNHFIGSRAGVAVMYTHDVEMRGNIFEQCRGASSYGLLLKEIQRGHIHHNHFRHNTVGILMDGGVELSITHNELRQNGWGMRVVASSTNDTISRNNFIGNTFDVATNGSFNSNVFDGNYWDKNTAYDLDHDGVADVPYHMLSLFSALAERNHAVLLFFRSFLMTLMEQSERLLPTITPDNYVDNAPSLTPFEI